MSYTPTTWKSGDVVTSEKLNKIEQGITNANIIINGTFNEQTGLITLDKTWQEIFDANGGVIIHIDDDTYIKELIALIGMEDSTYYVQTGAGNMYFADNSNSYPEWDGSK